MAPHVADAVTRAATDLPECHVAHDACTTLDMEFNGVLKYRQHMFTPHSAAAL
ncbi:hypothetical protein OH492_15680 [Vibrio chagasii]|nr:hypothetical protein [Vibrio chagasii]